jgi:formiminoglutamase
MSEDALWPRASQWLQNGTETSRELVESGEPGLGLAGEAGCSVDLAIVGVQANKTSISPTGANATPAAVRQALQRYSTWSWAHSLDVADLTVHDFDDNTEPDSPEGERLTSGLVALATDSARLTAVIGGDNSVTFAAMLGAAPDLSRAALITLDAHHDLRDGVSNGSPVRRLIEAGLPGTNVVQIGIADFSNSAQYAQRAMDLGITVIPRAALRHKSVSEVWAEALAVVEHAELIYVDFDVDVCDRAEVPACPAAAPGGISADQLREFSYLAGNTPKVRCFDITEIDANNDAPDQRTVRLAALLILEAAAGLAKRSR